MIFADLFFIYIFLPLNIIIYYSSGNKTFRNIVLIAFSMFFYAWGEPVWMYLLIITAFVDYGLARLIENQHTVKNKKIMLVIATIINLASIAVFKYSGFFVENINAILSLNLPVPKFALPIGISFYTFQALSYLVDVYRGDVKAQKNPAKFLLYLSMYHQLVAGPIVRYSDIAEEIDNRRTSSVEISRGLSRFIVGLAKKVMLANMAGVFAAEYLDGDLTKLSSGGAIFGIIMFTLQIYFDFSGYSDMAIGLGMVFGFHYHENFNYPYISQSVTDFWRRWHISLSSFFRDYVYIPLGGNKKHRIFNICVVWALTGLWHGASWNFVLWGLYFCVLLIIEKAFLLKVLEKIPSVFRHIYALITIVFGWALFYFTDMTRLGQFFKAMFTGGFDDISLEIKLSSNCFWIIAALIACLPVIPFIKKKWKEKHIECNGHIGYTIAEDITRTVFTVVLLGLCTILLAGKTYNPFLYYRF